MRLWLALVLLSACGKGSAPACGGYHVAAAAEVGCRSPSQPGCSSCCSETESGCVRYSASGASWYNDAQALTTACPTECPSCARCTSHDEDQLCRLLDQPMGCDCATVVIGVDPCSTSGCACWCSLYALYTDRCPQS